MSDSLREDIVARVKWWLNDMAYKPPEINWDWYYKCMAEDIADYATLPEDDFDFSWSSRRLDPEGD